MSADQSQAQVLDDTVVIPQFGAIRSLNVHVSGALGVYMYTCQHALAGV